MKGGRRFSLLRYKPTLKYIDTAMINLYTKRKKNIKYKDI